MDKRTYDKTPQLAQNQALEPLMMLYLQLHTDIHRQEHRLLANHVIVKPKVFGTMTEQWVWSSHQSKQACLFLGAVHAHCPGNSLSLSSRLPSQSHSLARLTYVYLVLLHHHHMADAVPAGLSGTRSVFVWVTPLWLQPHSRHSDPPTANVDSHQHIYTQY